MSIQLLNQNRVFLSYSRTEMYYAEAVTKSLQDIGFQVWFDLQQLEPGCVWEEEIEHGLAESKELVLIVSRAALASRWVAQEWQYAIDHGLKIHLVIFEAVQKDGYRYLDKNNKRVPINTPALFDAADNIIDGRRNFSRTISRLARAIQGDDIPRDSVPTPNRLGIPTRLPSMVAFVAITMFAIAVFWIWFTIVALITFPPVAIGSGIVAVLSCLEFRHFISRESFRGTRLTLFTMMFVAMAAVSPTFFLFLLAWFVSVYSLNVNRWSPRGEGARRGETSNWVAAIKVIKNGFRFLPNYATSHLTRQVGVMLVIIILGIWLTAILDLDDNGMTVAFFGTLLILLGLNVFTWFYLRHIRQAKPDSHKTFRIMYHPADTLIADVVGQTMDRAGHTRSTSGDESTDYQIVIATNFLQPEDFTPYLNQDGRWIVLVASNFEDQGWFENLHDYQWVDYRRHDPQQLESMVNELRATEFDIVSHSFSTRTTPQSFSNKIVLPTYVQSFVFWALVAINISFALSSLFLSFTFTINDAETSPEIDLMVKSVLLVLSFCFLIIPNLFAIWLVVKVMLRKTTVNRLARNILIYVTFFALLVTFNPALIIPALLSYFIIRWVTYEWLGRWLPVIDKDTPTAMPMVKPQISRALYTRSIVIAVVIAILTLTLIHSEENLATIVNLALLRF